MNLSKKLNTYYQNKTGLHFNNLFTKEFVTEEERNKFKIQNLIYSQKIYKCNTTHYIFKSKNKNLFLFNITKNQYKALGKSNKIWCHGNYIHQTYGNGIRHISIQKNDDIYFIDWKKNLIYIRLNIFSILLKLQVLWLILLLIQRIIM